MKSQKARGVTFLHQWQGEAPKGRTMPTVHNRQKGQSEANPEPERVWDKFQKTIIRKWRF